MVAFCPRDEKKKNPFYVLTFSSKEIANDFVSEISDLKVTFEEVWKNNQFKDEFFQKFNDLIENYDRKNEPKPSSFDPSCISLENDHMGTGAKPNRIEIIAEALLPELRFLGTSKSSRSV